MIIVSGDYTAGYGGGTQGAPVYAGADRDGYVEASGE
jgi:hypothetical protein